MRRAPVTDRPTDRLALTPSVLLCVCVCALSCPRSLAISSSGAAAGATSRLIPSGGVAGRTVIDGAGLQQRALNCGVRFGVVCRQRSAIGDD